VNEPFHDWHCKTVESPWALNLRFNSNRHHLFLVTLLSAISFAIDFTLCKLFRELFSSATNLFYQKNHLTKNFLANSSLPDRFVKLFLPLCEDSTKPSFVRTCRPTDSKTLQQPSPDLNSHNAKLNMVVLRGPNTTDFKPINSSNLRHSTSIDSREGSVMEDVSTTRRTSLPARRTTDDDDDGVTGPAINKSVLRGSTNALKSKINLSREPSPPSKSNSKRQRISSIGDYISTGTNGRHASITDSLPVTTPVSETPAGETLIVNLRYRRYKPIHNEPPEHLDANIYVSGQDSYGQMGKHWLVHLSNSSQFLAFDLVLQLLWSTNMHMNTPTTYISWI